MFHNFIGYLKSKIERAKFQRYSRIAIRKFAKLADDNSWEYFLTAGTLLGAYRDHRIIPHDDDVDIAIDVKHINKELVDIMLKAGFEKHLLIVSEDKKYKHVSFYYKGIIFDLYGYSQEEPGDEVIQFSPHAIDGDWAKSEQLNRYIVCRHHLKVGGFQKVPFENTMVSIPVLSKELLESIYGKNFMIPIKKTDEGYVSCSLISEELPIEQSYSERVSFDELS